MAQSLNLFRLQKIDSRRDQITSRLMEIGRILSEDQALKVALQQVFTSQQELQKARLLLNQAEEAVQSQQIKIEQSNSALYGGKIHNPKELQDLQNEIVALKKYLLILEDQQLDAMITLENVETQSAQDEKSLLEQKATSISAHSTLVGEQLSLQKEIERLDTERLAVISSVSLDMQKMYDRLRSQKRGLAVTSIHDSSCDACGSSLTPSELQIARSGNQMSYCPTCGRILYAG